MAITIEDMAAFCKKKGIVYPNSEIYGGMAGFFDYGPLGIEIINNIKREWWKTFVQSREDIVGIDGSIICHPKVWKASGHVDNFEDVMLTCSRCKNKVRADTFIEEQTGIAADGFTVEMINNAVSENKLSCPKCKSEFEKANDFNLMFKTNVGPLQDESSLAYLRPETAQLIFANFKLVSENSRLKLPFGIAQVGKAFRNEISPRNFLFRCREFEQMEIEYFIRKDMFDSCPWVSEVMSHEISVYSAEMQEKGQQQKQMTIKQALEKGIIMSPWHAYFLAINHQWFINLGTRPEHFRIRQHLKTEKSHYATDTWDLEYNFPFGYKELQGIADRGTFDLDQHIKHSKKDMSLFDEEKKEKVIPMVVAEPSLGVGRAFLVFLFDAYDDDKERGNIVLHLHPRLAPYKAAVFPLVNKLDDKAREIFSMLKQDFHVIYDRSGSIGRRYARADEQGIPFCVTIDFDTENDSSVTVRDRDSTKQERVSLNGLKDYLCKKLI
ncbi:glycine--tRNA ligase [Candidatus Woesearchaeota archaeon]|nr:glycine--tRNA ligase [Candidatus Woesearchaeota archaeon]